MSLEVDYLVAYQRKQVRLVEGLMLLEGLDNIIDLSLFSV